MLELKGLAFESVEVLPGMQRVHLRLARFRGGTVPALMVDGRRIQGSRSIARALDRIRPEPPLFPAEPEQRSRVEEAERWGDEELQDVPRRIFRWGAVHDFGLRRWLSARSGVPAPALAARLSGPTARYYARAAGADTAAVENDLRRLDELLDRADRLLADGTLTLDPPNAATFQILSTVRALGAFTDLHERVAAHASAEAARQVFPDYPEPVPAFLPRELLGVTPR